MTARELIRLRGIVLQPTLLLAQLLDGERVLAWLAASSAATRLRRAGYNTETAFAHRLVGRIESPVSFAIVLHPGQVVTTQRARAAIDKQSVRFFRVLFDCVLCHRGPL